LPAPQPDHSLSGLDLGCGSGALLAHILRARPDVTTAIGVDFSPALVRTAQDLAAQHGLSERLGFYCTDVLSPDPPVFRSAEGRAGSADVVIAGEILEHCVDYRALIATAEVHAKEG